MTQAPSSRCVVLSGCSGGGKSTLLAELGRRGFEVVEEPGRRIVRDELATGGDALPWVDLAAFARRAVQLAIEDLGRIRDGRGWVFFDRGLVDAAAALEHATGEPALETFGRAHRYHGTVFLAPPWPEIFTTEAERRHSLEDAIAEHERLAKAYPRLGYEIVELPKSSLAARADAVLSVLGAPP